MRCSKGHKLYNLRAHYYLRVAVVPTKSGIKEIRETVKMKIKYCHECVKAVEVRIIEPSSDYILRDEPVK